MRLLPFTGRNVPDDPSEGATGVLSHRPRGHAPRRATPVPAHRMSFRVTCQAEACSGGLANLVRNAAAPVRGAAAMLTARPCSSVGQSTRLVSEMSSVRFRPGAPPPPSGFPRAIAGEKDPAMAISRPGRAGVAEVRRDGELNRMVGDAGLQGVRSEERRVGKE